jgi:ribonuclease III
MQRAIGFSWLLFKHLFSKKDRKIFVFLRKKLGVYPANLAVFKQALTHPSINNNAPSLVPYYERLEFLGDSIFNTAITTYVFKEFRNKSEGELSRMRSQLVSRECLETLSKAIHLPEVLQHNIREVHRASYMYGNALEALLGALYLDQGFERAKAIIIKNLLKKHLDLSHLFHHTVDYKTVVQQMCQKYGYTLEYKFVKQEEVKHQLQFHLELYINQELVASVVSTAKKKAQVEACKIAYEKKFAQNMLQENYAYDLFDAENSRLVQEVLQQIAKDFPAVKLPKNPSTYQEVFQPILQAVQQTHRQDPPAFRQMLYRVDIPERALKKLFVTEVEPWETLAHKIIQRAKQKIISRKQFK